MSESVGDTSVDDTSFKVATNATIMILWKGLLFGVCNTVLYIHEHHEDAIFYTMCDSKDLKTSTTHEHTDSKTVCISGYILIDIDTDVDDTVADLLERLRDLYTAITVSLYEKEVVYGLKH